ncbi:hypothetical protein B0H16DRAFT_392967 [Mycena metata]|uniref:BTB domain-containing protein n=1 Tax=Mycena metata TaxID=1033252 RepID=A0AAD7MJ32_9AGAR|nr:hypothetical protein B0H16DRAFT_392967 [Mycena metata]
MLTMHSSVFRDLFTLPIPPDEAMIDNCSVVVLSGDTAQDWTLFLGALFPQYYSTEVPSLELLAAMLRLSKKYDFPLFRADCVRRLKEDLPRTLEEHDRLGLEWKNFTALGTPDAYLFLASLLREISLPSLLPFCYYSIIRDHRSIAMAKILDHSDHSVNTTDRLACSLGYAKLLKFQSGTSAWLGLDGGAFGQPRECASACTSRALASHISMNIQTKRHPLDIWILSKWNELQRWYGLCLLCHERNKARQHCWRSLPNVFGLPDWEELKALDFE